MPLAQQGIMSPQYTRTVSLRCHKMSILITYPCVTMSGGRSACVVTHPIPISIVISPSGVAKADSTCRKNGQFCACDIIC